jgi:hypothetical protein
MKPRNFRHETTKALALILVLAFGVSAAAKTKFNVLYNFTGGSDGGNPILFATLAADKQSNLYGATYRGGTGCGGVGCGVAFRTSRAADGKWGESVLFDMADTEGGFDSHLTLDSRGNLYGCTARTGPMFELTPGSPQWNFNPIWPSGCDGPVGLIFDGAGNLYGGFGNATSGGVSELSPTPNGWVETTLYEFCQQQGCPDGFMPLAPFSWDSKGNLYGTTYSGGDARCNCGVAFQMTPADGTWTYRVMHRFSYRSDGADPYGSLTVDSAGNAYGTTTHAGPHGNGNVFKLTPTNGGWKLTVLYGFPNENNGTTPGSNLVFDKAGNLFGIAGSPACNGLCGVIFKLSPQKNGEWTYSVMHRFDGTDGDFPNGLTMDSQGNIFGTTQAGGKYGYGVVFELTP